MSKAKFAGLIVAAFLLSAQTAGKAEKNDKPGPVQSVAATEQAASVIREIWSGSGPLHDMAQSIARLGPDEEE